MPGFHAIMVVRDEGDIIAQTLAHLLTWCDTLFVYDTGSLDETWDVVQDFAGRDNRVVPLGREPVLFSDSIRAWLFDRVRGRFRAGDWIARVDSDEFYHIPPPQFVRERLRRWESCVCSCQYDFLMVLSELKAWQDGRETLADRAKPIQERRRHFRFDQYPEQRLFRYRRSMAWPPHCADPVEPGVLARERIPVLHYRARDPLQVQIRCAIREPTAESGAFVGWHWKIADWRAWVFNADHPRLHYWAPGAPLPEHPNRLIERGRKARWKEQIVFRSRLVHLRDRSHPPFPQDYLPTPLAPEVQERIAANLAWIRERPFLRDEPPQVTARKQRGDPVPMPPGG